MGTDDASLAELFDLDRIESVSFLKSIDAHQALDSTNSRALQLASDPQLVAPCLVLTAKQTAGRGRGANHWWSAPGALTFSVIIDADLPAKHQSQLSLTVGVAICEALRELMPQNHVGLKWPNDVYLDGRKVSGILVEIPPRRSSKVVVGVGLNVNNSLQSAPDELRKSATSLFDTVGTEFSLSDVLILLLDLLQQRLEWLLTRDSRLAPRWEEFSLLRGKTVYIETNTQEVAGVCQGIDEAGGLLLRTPSGIERVTSGIVRRFD